MNARAKLSRTQVDALAYLSGVDTSKKPNRSTLDALRRRNLVAWVNSFASQPRNAYDLTDDGRKALRQHFDVHRQCPECSSRDLETLDGGLFNCRACDELSADKDVPTVATKWR